MPDVRTSADGMTKSLISDNTVTPVRGMGQKSSVSGPGFEPGTSRLRTFLLMRATEGCV